MTEVAKTLTYFLWAFGSLAMGLFVSLKIPRISYGHSVGNCPHLTSCLTIQELYIGFVFLLVSLLAGPKKIWFVFFAVLVLLLLSQAEEWRTGAGFTSTLITMPLDPLLHGGGVALLLFLVFRRYGKNG